MKKRRTWVQNIRWIIFIVVLLSIAGGGYAAYAYFFAPAEAPEQPTLQTATVSQGDLSITAGGMGILAPSTELELGFSSNGTLVELLVEVGDKVQAGDVLAWIDDTDARKTVADAELQVAQAEANLAEQKDLTKLQQSVTQAESKVAQAEANLASAQLKLDDLLNWKADESTVNLAEANLAVAQADSQIVVARS